MWHSSSIADVGGNPRDMPARRTISPQALANGSIRKPPSAPELLLPSENPHFEEDDADKLALGKEVEGGMLVMEDRLPGNLLKKREVKRKDKNSKDGTGDGETGNAAAEASKAAMTQLLEARPANWPNNEDGTAASRLRGSQFARRAQILLGSPLAQGATSQYINARTRDGASEKFEMEKGLLKRLRDEEEGIGARAAQELAGARAEKLRLGELSRPPKKGRAGEKTEPPEQEAKDKS